MSDQFHLVQRLVDAHRLGDVQLATDDNRRIPNLDLHGFARAKIGGDRSLRAVVRLFLRLLRLGLRGDNTQIHRDRVRVTTTVILATVTSTTQTQRQLIQRHVQRTEFIGAGSLRTHHGTSGDNGDFHALGGIGLTRVALMGQHDLRALSIWGDSGHTIHLGLDHITEPLLDLRVASGNDDFHVDLL